MKTLYDSPTKDMFTEDVGFSKDAVISGLKNNGARFLGILVRVEEDGLLLEMVHNLTPVLVPYRTIIGVCPMSGPMSAWNHAPEGAERLGLVPEQSGSRLAPFVFFMPGFINTPGWKEATPRPWWA